jgi:UDP-hydrolysing UDP-N-acetyl-D-glucosamine 2-epimerase
VDKIRSICVVTGSRADYGHLYPVMQAVADAPKLTLQTVVCGQHLEAKFGETWKVVQADGFALDAKVDIGLSEDTRLATAEATGRAVSSLAQAFSRLRPDIVLVLGDRFEIFAAGVAAILLRIPLAHVHGGEVTEAAMDEALRHALTKMAALHFVAAEPYAARVRQLGEDPARVFVTGAPGLDHLITQKFMTRDELSRDLAIDLSARFFVVTYHPVTLKEDYGVAAMANLAAALEGFPDTAFVFTGVNSDPGHAPIQRVLIAFCEGDAERRKFVRSLGQRRYLSAVKEADAVIGNSSSGLIEAPAIGTPTVNIGDRQKGRLRSSTVIDCGEDTAAIRAAISRALDPAFRKSTTAQTPAYGRGGGATAKIIEVLKTADLTRLSVKRFHDIIPAR